MKPIINLALRSEYSFKQTFGKVADMKNHVVDGYVGVADINNTFAHAIMEKNFQDTDVQPIFGVRIDVVKECYNRVRGASGPRYIFIAKNEAGFYELNKLTTKAWQNFYYKPMIGWSDLQDLSDDVIVISPAIEDESLRLDYLALTPSTNPLFLDLDVPKVYINDNYFAQPFERNIYQILAGSQKRKDGYVYKFDTKRAFQHILSSEEFYRIWKDKTAIDNTYEIAHQCGFKIPKAPMVTYKGKENLDNLCLMGAIKKGVDLDDPEYKERLDYELGLIKQKEFGDYFLIVAQMVEEAKAEMFVGPSRGSSAGSLVCYLTGITEIDPIKHGLIFERFIDINRHDFPDIDVDFPDEKRGKVIKNIFKTYGEDNVCHISNINKLKARSTLDEVGISLAIPRYEMDLLKDAVVDRSGGDARAQMSIKDTLETTDIGKDMMQKYPALSFAEYLQGHASHAGKHAAGIIVCNNDLSMYGAVNAREGSIMMDKHQAEYLNLLKIDALGLRTLSILQDCAEMIGMDYHDYYTLPLDDEKTFGIFNSMRLYGIFQFEGHAMSMLCAQMGVENFNDIVALTALARPGPLHSGGAGEFIKVRTGQKELNYVCDHPLYVEATEETYGSIIYQEQLMMIARKLGNMSWKDVSAIRKAASKSLGEDFFNKYKDKFIAGAEENGVSEEKAIEVWESMVTFGSWGMNKSHTVSYGYISYWCAYMKANHPLEFFAANLRHSKSKHSSIRILRDALENEGIEYTPVDPDHSQLDWTVHDGRLIGGLRNIIGIADKKAKEILACRAGKKKWTPALMNKLLNPVTDIDTIYPTRDLWGDLYENPRDYGLAFPPNYIGEITSGEVVIIGQVMKKDLRDLNEYNEIMKRGGKVLKDKNKSLKLVIEDDTGAIHCSVGRMKFDKLDGMTLYETLGEEKSWVIIKGTVNPGWKVVLVDKIFDLKNLEEEE